MHKTANQNSKRSSSEEKEWDRMDIGGSYMTDESVRVTREMLRLCHESQDAGAATLAMLHRQGAQLGRTEMALDSMTVGLIDADENLVQMQRANRCCGMAWFWPRRRKKRKQPFLKPYSSPTAPVLIQSEPIQIRPGENFVPRITNDVKEDEMEANLQGVSNVLGNMKKAANDMGSEITSQNSGIDRMNNKAATNQVRMASAQNKANTLLDDS